MTRGLADLVVREVLHRLDQTNGSLPDFTA